MDLISFITNQNELLQVFSDFQNNTEMLFSNYPIILKQSTKEFTY